MKNFYAFNKKRKVQYFVTVISRTFHNKIISQSQECPYSLTLIHKNKHDQHL